MGEKPILSLSESNGGSCSCTVPVRSRVGVISCAGPTAKKSCDSEGEVRGSEGVLVVNCPAYNSNTGSNGNSARTT